MQDTQLVSRELLVGVGETPLPHTLELGPRTYKESGEDILGWVKYMSKGGENQRYVLGVGSK